MRAFVKGDNADRRTDLERRVVIPVFGFFLVVFGVFCLFLACRIRWKGTEA